MFNFWDKHSEQLIYVGFLWLHDLSEAKASNLVEQYGMNGQPNVEAFKEYLGSLGMRTYEGVDKSGMLELREQARARGWVVN